MVVQVFIWPLSPNQYLKTKLCDQFKIAIAYIKRFTLFYAYHSLAPESSQTQSFCLSVQKNGHTQLLEPLCQILTVRTDYGKGKQEKGALYFVYLGERRGGAGREAV